MISAQSAIQAAGRDGPSGPVSVTEIGRNVKADIVIFATVDSFSLSPDGTSYRPVAVLRVRVIDVTKDERIWPASEEGLPVRVSLPPKTGDAPQSVGEVYKAEEELARAAGVQLAKVFYKHETARGPRDPG
jgi:hypothetical protein